MTTPKYAIRVATVEDVPRLSELYSEFYALNHLTKPEYCAPATENGDTPRNVIAGDTGDIFVAETKDGIMGFLHMEQETTPRYPSAVPATYADLVDLYVVEPYRGKGIGRQLLATAKEWARGRGLPYIELLVLGNNSRGARFYAREHFRETAKVMKLDV